MVWSIRDELTTPTVVTANQIYTRFIGDRSINEKDFGRVVKNRTTEMTNMPKILRIYKMLKLMYAMC